MALHENSPSQANFLTIKHHSICKELKPAPTSAADIEKALADGFQEITVENPSDIKADGTKGTVQKWVRKFGSLDGKIIGLEWYDREHSGVRYMGLKMKIRDEDTYILDLGFGTKGYDVFTRVMEDIDYSKPIEISVWHDKKAGNATAVLWRQEGNSIKWRYTKEWNNNIVQALGADKKTVDLAEKLSVALDSGALSPELMDAVAKAGYLLAPPPIHNPLGKPQWNFDQQRAFLWQRLTKVVMPKVEELNPKFDDPQPGYDAAAEEFPPAEAAGEQVAEAPSPPEFTGPAQPARSTGWTPPAAGEKTDAAF
jgi:hypothetical protein